MSARSALRGAGSTARSLRARGAALLLLSCAACTGPHEGATRGKHDSLRDASSSDARSDGARANDATVPIRDAATRIRDGGPEDARSDFDAASRAEGGILPSGTCAAPFAAASGRYDTSDSTDVVRSSCAAPGGAGPAVIFRYEAPAAGRVTAKIASTADLGISLRSSCDAELECSDDAVGGETVEMPVSKGQVVVLAVSGHASGDRGTFSLETSFKEAACGDGLLDGGEACDDENIIDGDGCSATCRWEACDAPTTLAVGVPANGVLAGPSLVRTACANALSGPEAVYAFIASDAGTYRVTVTPGPDLDVVVSARTACEEEDSASCEDSAFEGGVESVLLQLGAGEGRYLVIEGWGVPDTGAYVVEVTQDG